jgi:ABC-type Fe3+-hydroxamate transport system substrate-binding protein
MIRWTLTLAAMGALAIGALALAGCGDDEEDAPEGSDLTAISCPLVASGETVAGVEQFEPADDAFDTQELVGMKLDEARATAADHGCRIVVSVKDGRGIPVPIDVNPRRIYVYTENDVVTLIEGVGGGL